jgi:hypothetical protein
MSERSEKGELTELESMLRGLRPQPDTLDRAVLMYRAGQASARGWGWPLATLGATALAIVLGVLPLIRPASVVEHIVYLPAPAIEKERAAAPQKPEIAEGQDDAWQRYLRMQDQVLRRGLDGLPPPPAPSNDEPATMDSLLNAL